MWRCISIGILIFGMMTVSKAQQLRSRIVIATINDTLLSDTATIFQNSVQIVDLETNTLYKNTDFLVKNTHILRLKTGNISPQKRLKITYRTLPYNLSRPRFRLDSSIIAPLAPPIPIDFDYGSPPSVSDVIFDKSLDYNGNYTQGFSLGNAQNFVVNQNFNLNLAGKLGDLDILAAMTDQNLPIQAEGNTQQLRDFDQIYIQLKKNNHKLVAGDFPLAAPSDGYFSKYYKKFQGINYSNTASFKRIFPNKNNPTKPSRFAGTHQMQTGFAIARGKFARQTLTVSEGNQGPYRMLPTEGGGFFIILAGTERVFFDGKLLTRGENNDYIVDYNAGTLIFMPSRIVYAQARVIVEFEYADQNYLRTSQFFNNNLKINKLNISFSVYNEQDAKNASGTQNLDTLDRRRLSLAGNEAAVAPAFRLSEDGFRADRIQYRLVDTVAFGQRYTEVLVYTNSSVGAIYEASFSPVGEGKGDYIQDITAANGRVYRWIAPDSSGKKRGNFAPIRQLIAPLAQTLATLRFDYQPFKYLKITNELAGSRYDKNRFSVIGDSTNLGVAMLTIAENTFAFGKNKRWQITNFLRNEWTQTHFRPINPFRAAEFSRDWNLPQNSLSNAGNWFSGSTKLSLKNWFSASYEYSEFKNKTVFSGKKQAMRGELNRGNWQLTAVQNLLNTEGGGEKTHFERPNVLISKKIKGNNRLFLSGEREKNSRINSVTDTFSRASFWFDAWRIGYEKTGNKIVNWGVNFSQRIDYQAIKTGFVQQSKANEASMTAQIPSEKWGNLSAQMTYRDLAVADTSISTLKPQETYLGRIEWQKNAWRNALILNTLYEIGSGQEQRLEYQYVKVNKGEGQFIWNNRNGDTIPQLDEFDPAPFQDQADYVRVTLFTNAFVRTNNVSFSQTLRFEPRILLEKKKNKMARFASKFGTNSALQINRRVKNDFLEVSQWNPFELNVPDIALVALTTNARNTLTFNRNNPKWDIETGHIANRNRLVLVTGYEERSRSEFFIRHRLQLSQRFGFSNYVAVGVQGANSEFFKNRNFDFHWQKIEPSLQFQTENDWRLALNYKYKKGSNLLKINGERIKNNDFSLETAYNVAANAQIRARASLIAIVFEGDANTPVGFALLEGLQAGKNYLWSLNFDRSLTKSLTLSVSYEGRKTGVARVIHVGRAQVRANF